METPEILPEQQPSVDTPVQETVQETVTNVETPVETSEAQPSESTPTTEPTEVKPFNIPKEQPRDPFEGLTPESVAERFGRDETTKKALLQSLGYSEPVLNVLGLLNNPDGLKRYAEVMSVDYTALPDLTIRELRLKEELSRDGSLSEDEVSLLVEEEMARYKLDPDLSSEREVKLANVKLKLEAQKDREYFTQRQKSFEIPVQAPVEQPVEVPYDVQVSNLRQAVFQDPSIQQFAQARALTFGDPESPYTFQADPEQTIALIYDHNQYIYHTSLKNEKGEVLVDQSGQPVRDLKRMAKAAAYVANMDAIERGLIAHGQQLARRKEIDEAENVSVGKATNATPQADTIFDALLRKIK